MFTFLIKSSGFCKIDIMLKKVIVIVIIIIKKFQFLQIFYNIYSLKNLIQMWQ